MADEMDFDESLLFSEFEATAPPPSDILPCQDKCRNISSSMDVEALKEENFRLKELLKRLLIPETCKHPGTTEKPFFHAIFFNNEVSTESRQRLEYLLQHTSWMKTECANIQSPVEFTSLQPSVCQLNDFIVETKSDFATENSGSAENENQYAVVSYSHYFEFYCIDSCGFPLVNYTTGNSEGWEIPIYEQVFFTAIPCDEEGSQKVKIRRKKACFNCGNVGHNVSDCPEPQNQARIDSQRQQFIKKFSSPFAKDQRYHIDEKRFGAFKPGIISDELRNALGIKSDDVPPYIYKMRHLGYPPGYIPGNSNSTLVLYNGDGIVEDYVMEDLDQEDEEEPEKNVFIEYPGFNCPLPEGIQDRSREYGCPPMSPHQSIHEMVRWYRHVKGRTPRSVQRTPKTKNKRSWSETNDGGDDMDLDEDQGPSTVELPSHTKDADRKRRKHDLSEGGYSPTHPDIQCGTKEQNLLDQFHQSTSTKSHMLQNEPQKYKNQQPVPFELNEEKINDDTSIKPTVKKPKIKRIRSSGSLEDGEILSDEESEMFQENCENTDEKEVKMNQGWWLTKPLTTENCKAINVTPPPVPSVKLPMDLLTRFYTSSTCLKSISFEDRIMWLDPIYGNIQVSSGRYDKLKEILQQKKVRKDRR